MTRVPARRANSIMLADTAPPPARPKFVEHDYAGEDTRVGPHEQCSREEILALLSVSPLWPRRSRRTGPDPALARLAWCGEVLDWLLSFPGEGWQARWRASGADAGKRVVIDAVLGEDQRAARRAGALRGVSSLITHHVVLPGYRFLRGYGATGMFKDVQAQFPDGRLAQLRSHGTAIGMTPKHVDDGLKLISSIILHTGCGLEEITTEDVFRIRAYARRTVGKGLEGTHAAWELLRGVGIIEAKDPLKDTLRHGQRPTAELVDSYNVQNTEIRNVLVRYLEERRPAVDYGTFRSLVRELVGVFWADIEAHHPGIDTLRLPQDVIDGWKARLTTYTHATSGEVKERRGRIDVMMRVRGFYLDIQEWAHEDAFWVPWAVPSPISRRDGAGNHKILAQTRSRMHQRVRDRLPHLPALVETAERVMRESAALLDAASATALGEQFEHAGRLYQRAASALQRRGSHFRPEHASPHVFIHEVGVERKRPINQTHAEESAFWAWAVIETLRHTGVRVEELTEVTHLALVSYKLADTGEVVPLLQIVPSKSNEERLLPVD